MLPITRPEALLKAKAVAVLERADRDTTTAKRFLKVLEKALAIHVADRDRLTKRLARRGS